MTGSAGPVEVRVGRDVNHGRRRGRKRSWKGTAEANHMDFPARNSVRACGARKSSDLSFIATGVRRIARSLPADSRVTAPRRLLPEVYARRVVVKEFSRYAAKFYASRTMTTALLGCFRFMIDILRCSVVRSCRIEYLCVGKIVLWECGF